ncbi:gluconokinase [Enterococcus sp. LJL90]
MQNQTLFLSIDIGTTAIKFGLIDNSQLVWETLQLSKTYQVGAARFQKRSELYQELKAGIAAIPDELRQRIKTIGFSVAMHSLFPYENDSSENIFLWSDAQAKETIKEFKSSDTARQFYLKTGTPIHPMTPFAKIMYFNEQGTYPQNMSWYGLKECLMQLFTGQWRLDLATASATGLLNLNSLSWDAEILDFLNLTEKQLAPLTDTTELFPILAETANDFSLPTDCQIMIGASDGSLATYAGFKTSGIPNSLTIGTSAALRKLRTSPRLDPIRQNFCYYLHHELYVTGAPSNNGGNVLAWASDILFEETAHFYQGLPTALAASPIGAKGLRFAPYLNGERAPLWDMDQTAGFQKITSQHRKADFVRAVTEGVLMNIRTLQESLGEMIEITVNGGFFQTTELSQMTADVLGATCYLTEKNEPIFGLYYLHQTEDLTPEVQENYFVPDETRHQEYEKLFANYFIY